METQTPYSLFQSITTDYDVEKVLSLDHLVIGYNSLDFRTCGVTNKLLRLLTKKNFSSKKEVVNKHIYDLFSSEHAKLVDLYFEHNNISSQNGEWHGIEPCYLDGEFTFNLSYKKAIFDREGKIAGIIYYGSEFMERKDIHSLLEMLKFSNEFVSIKKDLRFEFYKPEADINLTDRESECLFYTLRGKSAKSIGCILKISQKTVEYYIGKIKYKFACFNKSQLIDKAIEQGYLNKIPASLIQHHKRR